MDLINEEKKIKEEEETESHSQNKIDNLKIFTPQIESTQPLKNAKDEYPGNFLGKSFLNDSRTSIYLLIFKFSL